MEPKWTFDLDELLQHTDFLRRLARGVIGDEHRAEDLVQETYVTALERAPGGLDGPSALRGWLGKVIRNRAINALRTDARRGAREVAHRDGANDSVESTDVELGRIEVQRGLIEAVSDLRSEQRTAVYLRFYEGLMPKQISERTGIPVKTVNTRIARGLENLRTSLDQRAHGDRRVWLSAMLPLTVNPGALTPHHPTDPPGTALTTTTKTLGGIAVNKLIAVSAVLLALTVVWRVSTHPPTTGPELEAQAAAPADRIGSPEPIPPVVQKPETAQSTGGRTALEAPTTTEPAQEATVLSLRVLWSNGTPASGTVVDLVCWDDPAPRERILREVVGDDGEVRFDRAAPGNGMLTIDRGFELREFLRAGSVTRTVWTLPAGVAVEGRVVDPQGRAVGHAEIWLQGSYRSWETGTRATVASADGTFRLEGLDAEAMLGARAGGHQPSLWFEVQHLPISSGEDREITLRLGDTGYPIEGRVLDPDAQPVSGAFVRAGFRGGNVVVDPPGIRGTAPGPVSVTTDSEGRFRLPGGYPSKSVPIHALADGYPTWSGTVDVRSSGLTKLEIQLQRGASLEGTVVDALGRPVADARLVCARQIRGGWYEHAFPPAETKTGPDGRYRMELLAPGTQELNVTPNDQRLGRSRTAVTFTAGETTELDLTLDPNPVIAGRVEDVTGRGIAGWQVTAKSTGLSGSAWYPRQCVTDEHGSFLLTNVGNMPHDVSTYPPGQHFSTKTQVVAEAGDRDVVLVVDRTEAAVGHVTGVMKNADGSVPVGAWLTLHRIGESEGQFIDFDTSTGAFRHGPAEAGDYRIELMPGAGAWTSFVSDAFTIDQGATTDLGLLTARAPGWVEIVPGPISLRELEEIGLAFAHAETEVQVEARLIDGRLISGDLMPGLWRIICYGTELFVRQDVEVQPGQITTVELEFQRASQLEFDLRLPQAAWTEMHIEAVTTTGVPLRQVTWWQPQGESHSQHPTIGLPPGPALIRATTDTGLSATAEVIVEAHPAEDLAVVLTFD